MQEPTIQFDPNLAWQPYGPSEDAPWNATRVARLHRRAGFGRTCAQLARDLGEGFDASIDRVLTDDFYSPDGRTGEDYEWLVEAMSASCAHQPAISHLAHLGLYRLVFSPFPLAEKMIVSGVAAWLRGPTRTSATESILAMFTSRFSDAGLRWIRLRL